MPLPTMPRPTRYILDVPRPTMPRPTWPQAYLKPGFFAGLGGSTLDSLLLIVAEDVTSGEMVAAALNVVSEECIYGRYWGCSRDSKVDALHFELCYYQVLED